MNTNVTLTSLLEEAFTLAENTYIFLRRKDVRDFLFDLLISNAYLAIFLMLLKIAFWGL
jgi:hypothetical protein